ncbi:hypothetical protein [Streptomyces sp. NPDC101234]|uniref:hypothetical protein n=1 Tax=Streptomyces sp. NPDC101234 TaxID=3366138 RepID=UPI003808565C
MSGTRSDGELLRAIAADADRRAFEELYRRYAPWLTARLRGRCADQAVVDDAAHGTGTVGTQWGGNRVPEFAVGVARVLVVGSERTAESMCDAGVVTTMWLAVATDPTPEATFRHLRIDDSLVGSAVVLTPDGGSMGGTAQQTQVVRELLREPHDTVAARVKSHWQELTSPDTTTAQAARLLGVKVPKGADDCPTD